MHGLGSPHLHVHKDPHGVERSLVWVEKQPAPELDTNSEVQPHSAWPVLPLGVQEPGLEPGLPM